MSTPHLYLLVYVGPLGLTDVDIRVIDKEMTSEEVRHVAHGEGQSLLFKLVNYDCSEDFAVALKTGKVAEAFKNKRFYVDLHKLLKTKEKSVSKHSKQLTPKRPQVKR